MSRKERRKHLQSGYKDHSVDREQRREDSVPVPDLADINTVPEVMDADIAFPCRFHQLTIPYNRLEDWEKEYTTEPMCRALSKLFFNGLKKGKGLDSIGIIVKPGFDESKILRYICATLGDCSPKHEEKISCIAHMLRRWCTVEPVA